MEKQTEWIYRYGLWAQVLIALLEYAWTGWLFHLHEWARGIGTLGLAIGISVLAFSTWEIHKLTAKREKTFEAIMQNFPYHDEAPTLTRAELADRYNEEATEKRRRDEE